MDEQRIRAFVASDYSRVVATVALVCGDRQRAEDAVQDALVRAWERRDDIVSLDAWVTAVALNQARSGWRRRAAEHRALTRLTRRSAPPPPTIETDTDQRLADALAALPRRQREVAVLHYYLDLGVDCVAELLSVSEGTVKTCLHRARASLRVALAELADDEETRGRD